MAVQKLNEPAVTNAACACCGAPLESYRLKTGMTHGHVESEFQIAYACVNENCRDRYRLTIQFTHGAFSAEPAAA